MKRRVASQLAFIAVWMLTTAAVASAQSKTTVCLLPAVPGFETLGKAGGRVVGALTSDPKRLRIYVAAKGDVLYWHSNYSPTGSGNPVKIATAEKLSARQLLAVTLTPSLFLQEERRYGGSIYDSQAALLQRWMNEVTESSRPAMIVEPDVVRNPRFSHLDLESIGVVRVETAATLWDGSLGTILRVALGIVGLIVALAAGQLLFTWGTEWVATRFERSPSEIDPATQYLVITHLTEDQRRAFAGALQRSTGVEEALVPSEDSGEYQHTVGLLTAARRAAFRHGDEQRKDSSVEPSRDEQAGPHAASPVDASPRWEVHFAPDPIAQSSGSSLERNPHGPVAEPASVEGVVERSRPPA